MMSRLQGADSNKPLSGTIILRCAFVGGDDDERGGGFTGEQLRYPCKLRRHICARCGMHRGEHGGRPSAGIRDDEQHLPPRKRSVFRRLGESSQLPDLGGGESEDDDKREGQLTWTPGDAIDVKGKRGARRRRAGWCQL